MALRVAGVRENNDPGLNPLAARKQWADSKSLFCLAVSARSTEFLCRQSLTVPLRTRHLHKFIGAALGTRNEVLSILHLLDKPEAIWDDPGADHVYSELRAEFDLVDRYHALELKLRSV
jgi:hypothetical protein